MPRSLGVEITIGAVLASSVMSSLGSVTQKFEGLNGKIRSAGQAATVTGKALELAVKKADIEARVAAGEQGLEKQLQRVTSQYEKAAREASRYGTSVREWEAAQRKANAELARLEKIQKARTMFSDNSRKITEGMGGGIAIGATLGSAVSSGMSFEQQMSKVGAISRASEEDMAKLTAQAKQLGAETEWSASQAAQGMQYLAMAGFSTENTMKAMPGMLSLASAGAIDLGRAADISSNILSGFNLKAEEMGRVGDVLVNTFTSSNSDLSMLGETMKYVAPTAVAFGSSLEQTAAMAGKLHDAGIQGSMAGTALRAMMVRLSKPRKEAAAALDALGVKTKDANGKLRSMPDILADIAKAEEKLSQAGRMRATATIFGTEALSAANVLMQQAASGSLQEYEKSLYRQGSAAEVATKQNDNLAGDVKVLGSVFEALQLTIYERVQPALRAFTQKVTDVIGGMKDWMDNHRTLSNILIAGAAAIAGVAAAIIPAVTAFKTLQMAVALVKAPFLALNVVMAASPIGLVVTALGALVAAAIYTYNEFEPFRQMMDRVFAGMKAFGSWLADGFTSAWNSLGNMVSTAISAMSGPLETLKSMLNGIIQFVSSVFSGGWSSAWNGIVSVVSTALSMLTAPMDALKIMLNGIVTFVQTLFTQGWSAAWSGLGKAASAAFSALTAPIENMKTTLNGVIDFVGSVFGTGWANAWNGIKSAFSNVWGGLVEMVKAPLNAVIDMVNQAIGGFNSFANVEIMGKKFGIEIPQIPKLAEGGIATAPVLSMIGEGRGPEAVIPLDRLDSLLPRQEAGSINVTFSPSITVQGQGKDADIYASVRNGLTAGVNDLRRELEKLMAEQRRLSYA